MIAGLLLWEDLEPRAAPEQMAVDEALFSCARSPVVRFYRWASPAVTFGYAQRYSEVLPRAGGLPLIRRWTGGGTVFHGEDLTIAISVPEPHPLCRQQTGAIYQQIHSAIFSVVKKEVSGAMLATPEDCRPGPACFQSPAWNDILDGGRKICGGALRRGKAGLLYQGSLHGSFSVRALAHALSASAGSFVPDDEVQAAAARLESTRYGTAEWNQSR